MFNEGTLKLVNDVLLDYNFLYQDDKDSLVEDPTQWDIAAFRKWKSRGYPLNTDAYNTSKAGNNVNTANATFNATNTTGPASKTKLENDAWLSWRRSKQDETAYPLLENDQMYTDWIVKIKRKLTSEEMSRMIDLNFHQNQLSTGSDTLLFEAQENHMASVLERVLQTSE